MPCTGPPANGCTTSLFWGHNAMKEINSIIAAYNQLDFSGTQAALATVIRVQGSSYRREGARMLICSDGQWTGGISGGCLEGDTLRKARQAIFQQKSRVVTYDTMHDDPFQIGVGLGCKGIIDVLIEPLNPEDKFNPIHFLKKCQGRREPCVLVTGLHTDLGQTSPGERYLLTGNGVEYFRPGAARFRDDCYPYAAQVLTQECSGQFQTAAGMAFFVELIKPSLQLLVFGSNYDVIPLLEIGKTLGWNLSVFGDVKKLGKRVFDIADVVQPDFTKAQPEFHPDAYSAAVLMAHDYKTDFSNLQILLPTTIPYIAMLGPKKRYHRIVEELEHEGIPLSAADENRLHGPAGLDIGATSPEAIALSIASEIQACFQGRKGGFLRERNVPIYAAKPELLYAK